MSLVKMYGRTSFSSSWAVVGGFGIGGDSGAWIVDAGEGRVVGVVLAEQRGLAYFCPLEVVLGDVEEVLGCEVGLPGLDHGGDGGSECSVEGQVVDGGLGDGGISALEGQVKADSVTYVLEAAGRHGVCRRVVRRKPVGSGIDVRRTNTGAVLG